MRAQRRARGTAGSTFDTSPREAGVSRGLLPLLLRDQGAAARRRRCDATASCVSNRSSARLSTAQTADDFIGLMAEPRETVAKNRTSSLLVSSCSRSSRRNADIAGEYAALMRRTREQVAAHARGRPERGHHAPARAARGRRRVLFSLGDGLAMRMLPSRARLRDPASIRPAHAVSDCVARIALASTDALYMRGNADL